MIKRQIFKRYRKEKKFYILHIATGGESILDKMHFIRYQINCKLFKKAYKTCKRKVTES